MTTGSIVSLGQFNADSVAHRLRVPPEKKFEFMAMRHLYRCFQQDTSLNHGMRNESITDSAVKDVAYRYALYKTYADDFFESYPMHSPNMQALAVALICGQHVDSINGPLPMEEGMVEPVYRNDGFDDSIVDEAAIIWGQADAMKSGKLKPDQCVPESIFLFHVHVLEDFYFAREKLLTREPNDLTKLMSEGVVPAYNLAVESSEIGKLLKDESSDMEVKILNLFKAQLVTPEPSAAKKPFLRLVHSNPAP